MADNLILLVEDNPDDEALTLRALRKSDVMDEIIVARDGVEALDFLFGAGAHAGRDTRVQPSLTLLDLKLPKVDGLEVLRRLRADARTRLNPVVVLSTSNQHDDIVSSYALGANSFVRKPVDFGHFVDVARQLGTYWLSVNRPPVLSEEA